MSKIFVRHKNDKLFSSKILLDEKLGNAEDGLQINSPLFVLVTCYEPTSFLLHVNVSLKRNMNFVHDISPVKYNAFKKFPVQMCNDKNFSHKLFGIEINLIENKENYGTEYLDSHNQFYDFQQYFTKVQVYTCTTAVFKGERVKYMYMQEVILCLGIKFPEN